MVVAWFNSWFLWLHFKMIENSVLTMSLSWLQQKVKENMEDGCTRCTTIQGPLNGKFLGLVGLDLQEQLTNIRVLMHLFFCQGFKIIGSHVKGFLITMSNVIRNFQFFIFFFYFIVKQALINMKLSCNAQIYYLS